MSSQSSTFDGLADPMSDDFLSPRTKIAKMLADIDDAPTPSPPARHAPLPNTKVASPFLDESDGDDGDVSSQPIARTTDAGYAKASSDIDEDADDDLVRRPAGRAARSMLQNATSPSTSQVRPALDSDHDGSDEDLYSATPVKSSGLKRKRDLNVASTRPLTLSPAAHGNSLFVSPAKSLLSNQDDAEDDLPANPLALTSKQRLAQLVAQKREERLALEAAKAAHAEDSNQIVSAHASLDLPDEIFEAEENVAANPEVDRILSDAARPTRKASKRALLEMERETQRMSRQQALAHQMKVKKKFSTTELFAKFNFRQTPVPSPQPRDSSSAPNSDPIDPSPARSLRRELRSTPPSSPPTPFDKQKMLVDSGALAKMVPIRQDTLDSMVADDEELPDIDELLRSSQRPLDVVSAPTEHVHEEAGSNLARWGKKSVSRRVEPNDHNDDLEILQPMPRHLQVFDRVQPAKKAGSHSNAIHILKHLSHIGQNDARPNKPGSVKPSVHPQVLEARLRKRAREQAHEAQLERLQELRAKGIIVQNAEERERESESFENLLEKARQEAEDLRKSEKAARKEAGEEVAMDASDDESEDGDYAMSGSEDEGEGVGNDGNELVDDAADESTEDEGDAEGDEDDAEVASEGPHDDVAKDPSLPVANSQLQRPATQTDSLEMNPLPVRKSRKSRAILEDDEDEDGPTVAAPREDAYEDPFAAFGFGGAGAPKIMSPTQAFNATMQTPTQEDSQMDGFDMLGRIAPMSTMSMPPTFQSFDADATADESQTQRPTDVETQEVQLNWETQLPETPVPGLTRQHSGLVETLGWEPTQDAGMVSPCSAVRRGQLQRELTLDSVLEEDNETQPTVQLRVSESPMPSAAHKRGRLTKRKPVVADDSDEDVPQPNKKDAFREMKRRRIETLGAADRAEAELELKRMMEDQAEESEDEYAGLGGDDTDMIAPETAEDAAMIDSSHVEVDERAIAAHFADRQRADDEEATKKLYKDLTTGALRRRTAGGGWDLDEDEDDVVVRRRQIRQREEAKKRRLLLQDEGVRDWMEKGKQTKGKDAFLRAIADDDAEVEDVVDLDDQEPDEDDAGLAEESQQSQIEAAPLPLQEVSGNTQRAEADIEVKPVRPRPQERRLKVDDAAFSRPTSLLQVRESLSFLLDEPGQANNTFVDPDDVGSDSEDEYADGPLRTDGRIHLVSDDEDEAEEDEAAELARQNSGGFAPNPKAVEDAALMPPPRLPALQRRTPAKPVAGAVLDRLSLKRGNSSSSSSTGSRSAWGNATAAGKAPSLMRRATTNMTASGANERGVTIGHGARASGDRGVTVGAGTRSGSWKSSFAAQARAEERRAVLEAGAVRKAEATAKVAALRRAASASMSRMSGGGWE
ncbi:hypothetical protein B0A48_11682 [Cryoendolithus antarcticus]|uniref:DNA replication checkpoint mediator MRC1 domain-containing protein n=1 Tax=Cryoendolithus antarcticus TaxID=1507870 RepID=A0A1V8SST6_9PEZI|nr:hypothetical protein B0A48_11682 [Cryoendolithus antarcticus]